MVQDNYLDYSVKGSVGNEQWARQAEIQRPYLIASDSLNAAIEQTIVRQGDASSLFAERSATNEKREELKREFILSHPNSWLSAIYVLDMKLDSVKVYLDRLLPEVRNGFLKRLLDAHYDRYLEYQAYLESQKVIREGSDAPAFTLADRDGKTVSLADIATEYVVLDFWGSWCGPCIAGFPKMKEYYARYKSRVEFAGIACNDRHEEWIAALDKYTTEWTQLFDNSDDKISVKYAVGAFPTKIILGPAANDGSGRKIARIFVGERDEFYKALDELLK